MKVFTDSMKEMSPEDLEEICSQLKLSPTRYTPEAVTVALKAAIRLGGFLPYQIAVIVANAVAKALIGRGLSLGANAALTRLMGTFAGPIGWILSAGWMLMDIAGAAYRVTIPTVIMVAYLRRHHEQATAGEGSEGMTLSCEQQSDLESVVIAGFGSVGEIEMFQMQLWDRKMYERLESMSMSWWEPDQPFAFPAFNATTTTVAVDGFGNATMDHPDGLHYEGEWCESKPHGQGTLTWDDDGRYGGDWHEGKPHGRGSLTWPDGQQCYEGEWRKGKRHGQGTLKWVDDDGNDGRYEGEWRKGKRHGQGIFKCGGLPYGGGLHYDGDWRKGKPHGQGTFTWVDDDGNEGHYQGDWRKGRPHGQGVVTRPDGCYEGEPVC